MSGLQNAQDFIRALKASSDPPHVGGPLKIDIATEAWQNTQLYVPNKAEAIVEWILTRLLKDKSKDRSSNPVRDFRYWALLSRVLLVSGADKHGDHGRTLRAWLVPLLNRVPTAPIVLSYLEAVATEGPLDGVQHALVTQCIVVLWPLAVPKFNPETLLECFGAALRLVVALGDPDLSDGCLQALDDRRALSLIVSSYRTALSNSGSKRKQLYTLFLQKHLDSWLQLASRSSLGEGAQPSLACDIYDAGIETIFGLDILKPAADQKHESALTDTLERTLKSLPGTVLRTLPCLFASHVQMLKRHKGALFGQGSSQAPGHTAEQLQIAAMVFYSSCDALACVGEDDASWRCRVALLEVVEKEILFSPKDEDARVQLRLDGDTAADALSTACDGQHLVRIDSAVNILSLLTRIDHDLMSVRSAAILPKLAAIPPSVPSALEYLDLLLEYDSKTRNLPTSTMHVSGAFSVQHLQRVPGGPRTAYTVMSAGPLTSLHFLDRISSAVHSFLTPGQVLETVKDVARTLKDAYELFLVQDSALTADRGDGPRKKRKKDKDVSQQDRTEPEYYAVSFALIARTTVVVLRSLPLHILTEDTRLEAQRAVGEVHSVIASRALADGLLHPDRMESWHWQMAVAGALRLHCGLVRAPGLEQQSHLEQPLSSAMLSLVATAGVSPELIVETFRTLLHQCSLDTLKPAEVLDRLLGHLETHLPAQSIIWTGNVHALSSDAEAALALLHLLVDRWLPDFDTWSTSEQRQRFVQILTSVKLDDTMSSSPSGLSAPLVISRMLHDAQFWELLNTRDAFLAQVNEQTAPLDRFGLSELLTQLAPKTPLKAQKDVLRFTAAYDILLLAPPEYIPRPMQVEILKRGLVADVLAFQARSAKKPSATTHQLLVIREFLRRTIAFLGILESVMTKEFLYYLIEHAFADTQKNAVAGADVSSITMELIDMYQGALVRFEKRGNAEVLTVLVNRYATSYKSEESLVGKRPSLLLIDSIVREGNVADFPSEVVQAVRALYTQMLAASKRHLSPSSSGASDVLVDLDVLDTWSHAQTLRRWLAAKEEEVPLLGMSLSRRLFSWTGDKQHAMALAPVVLSILLGEVQAAAPAERAERLQYVVVMFLSLVRACGRDVTLLESRIGSGCRTFSAKDFGVLLELLYEGLPLGCGLSAQDIASLIRFSAIVLHDAPESTSKICQSFTTRCLNLFADDERFISVPDLRKEVVDFIVRQCSDRPASLRTADLSSLWSILHVLLAGSSTHEQTTDTAVFHGAINILSAVVRLRRDLVLNTLPHLGFVLRQLVSCLRSLRPQLGGKQRRLVLDTLPRWLAPAPAHALGAVESRALARLLTTLTVKTMVRTHGPGAETQKPEALVRPFSKHAAYVLTAYVDAVGDPLCFVPGPVRKELQPGLFALCEMLGEHNRDAMMVAALDAGGKATMKTLWKEYEKQRYVGKG